MKCTKCGKTFASHTDGPEICFNCYMKDINNYQGTNNSSNCDMPLHQDFSKKEGWICPVCGRGVAPWMSFVRVKAIGRLLGQQELVQTLILT